MDRISEWKRRDEERRRELEEKRKREQEEEIRRLREQEKEEKEKRKEKAEKGEEAHSDSDSSADDEVAKKGRKGRAKAPSSSDSDLEMEKEVSAMLGGAGGAGGRQQQPVLSLPHQQEPPGAPGPAVLAFFYPGEHGEGLCATGSCVLAQEAPSSSHPCDALPAVTAFALLSSAEAGEGPAVLGCSAEEGCRGLVARGRVSLSACCLLPCTEQGRESSTKT